MTNLVEGWTEPVTAQLLADGVPVNITGASVAFLLYNSTGSAVTLGGTASIVTAASGDVQYAPSATDFLAAATPHKARWRITDVAGKVSFFPSGEAETIIVRKP